jgi:hypothetical protein
MPGIKSPITYFFSHLFSFFSLFSFSAASSLFTFSIFFVSCLSIGFPYFQPKVCSSILLNFSFHAYEGITIRVRMLVWEFFLFLLILSSLTTVLDDHVVV